MQQNKGKQQFNPIKCGGDAINSCCFLVLNSLCTPSLHLKKCFTCCFHSLLLCFHEPHPCMHMYITSPYVSRQYVVVLCNLKRSTTCSLRGSLCEFGHWVCGESWLAIKDLQPTAPVGIWCPAPVYVVCSIHVLCVYCLAC